MQEQNMNWNNKSK